MDRRAFIATVGTSLLWPALIRRAFADASFDAPGARKRAPGLASARRRALAANKPLFVIVVPANDGEKYLRGGLWGEYLNWGDAAQLAPLARAEVQCATMKELAPLAPDVKGEPLAVVVNPDGKAHALAVKVPEHSSSFLDEEDDPTSARRIDAMASLVRSALGAVAPAQVGAAHAEVVGTLQKAPPSGAHWANATACGMSVEDMKDNNNKGWLCGQAHVPAKASRFLYFFSKSPLQMQRERIAEQEKQWRKSGK
jgi:hypothetical protein